MNTIIKLIFAVILIKSNILSAIPLNTLVISNLTHLNTVLKTIGKGEELWLMLPMADSYENKLIEEISEEPDWETLRQWKPVSFEDFREAILAAGCTIERSEIYRNINQAPSLDWIQQELGSICNLDEESCRQIEGKILSKQPFGIYKQLLMQLRKS